jgi:hypothetical protein
MKKIELFCILFILHVYNNYIHEDWSFYTKLGKIYYYPFWFIRSIIIWIICPIFILEYLFKNSKIYKEIQKIMNSPEIQKQLTTMKL